MSLAGVSWSLVSSGTNLHANIRPIKVCWLHLDHLYPPRITLFIYFTHQYLILLLLPYLHKGFALSQFLSYLNRCLTGNFIFHLWLSSPRLFRTALRCFKMGIGSRSWASSSFGYFISRHFNFRHSWYSRASHSFRSIDYDVALLIPYLNRGLLVIATLTILVWFRCGWLYLSKYTIHWILDKYLGLYHVELMEFILHFYISKTDYTLHTHFL